MNTYEHKNDVKNSIVRVIIVCTSDYYSGIYDCESCDTSF